MSPWGAMALVVAMIAVYLVPLWLSSKVSNHQIRTLQTQNEKLYRDNQALTEALCQKSGQPVHFKSPEEAAIFPQRDSKQYIPYWGKSIQEVQIGDKTVRM